MTEKKITILKLGGSLLTDKAIPYKVREGILDSIALEVAECMDLGLIEQLLLIHGVGSFGHPPVIEYKLYEGFKDVNQLFNLSKTQSIVSKLRSMIVDSFIKAGIPVNLMYTSSMLVKKEGKIATFAFDALKGFLSLGMVPLIGGDIVYDEDIGFSVYGGDLFATHITRELGAHQLIFASDVEGVYDRDPKLHSDAEMIKEISINTIEGIVQGMEGSNNTDITGRMKGKLLSIVAIKDLIKKGLNVSILSMKKPNILKNYLQSNKNLATRITY
jgi:isopentenyl phosphate kinase